MSTAEEERAYIDFLSKGIRAELDGGDPLEGWTIRCWSNRTWRNSNGDIMPRGRWQKKILVKMPDGRCFVPHVDGSNGTDDRATEALREWMSYEDISAERFIEELERRRSG